MCVLAVATLAALVLSNRSLEIAQVVAVVVAAAGATVLPEHLVLGLFILSLAAAELGVALGDSDETAPPTETGYHSSLTPIRPGASAGAALIVKFVGISCNKFPNLT